MISIIFSRGTSLRGLFSRNCTCFAKSVAFCDFSTVLSKLVHFFKISPFCWKWSKCIEFGEMVLFYRNWYILWEFVDCDRFGWKVAILAKSVVFEQFPKFWWILNFLLWFELLGPILTFYTFSDFLVLFWLFCLVLNFWLGNGVFDWLWAGLEEIWKMSVKSAGSRLGRIEFFLRYRYIW